MSRVGDSPPEFRGLLWLALAMVLCSAAFISYLPLWLSPALAALGWWRLRRARHGHSAPPAALRGAIAISLAGALVLSDNIGFGLDSAIPLYITFLWLKLLEIKNERDLFMAAYLSCFLAGAGVLLDQGLGHTAFAVLALLCVLAATLGHHLRAGRSDLGLRFALGRAGTVLLQAAPAAAILFLLIPRPHMPFPVERGQGTSGISDKLRPGDFDQIALSHEVAFRVTFPEVQPPAAGELYWRGLVLTGTDGIGWYREPLRLRKRPTWQAAVVDDGRRVIQDITLLPHLRDWIYALDPPLSWSSRISMAPGGFLTMERPVASPLTYRISSDLRQHAVDADPAMLDACLVVPQHLDPRLAALAQQWRERGGGEQASAAAISAAALAWFSERGFTYSLQPGVMAGDQVASFLFERRSGFCSHYSSAFALLLRVNRIPARVVVGYHGGEWNDLGDFLSVRQSHAHAWCEVWDERQRHWLRIDPTSAVVVGEEAERRASEGSSAVSGGGGEAWLMLRVPRKWWDYVDTTWENWMFRYDGSTQSALAQRLGLGAWAEVALVAGGILGAALCLAVVWWALRRRGRRRDPAVRLYQRWCNALARHGCVRQDGEAPLAFAARASLLLPARATEIHAVTAAYCAARYATADPSALARLHLTLRQAGARPAPR